MDVEELKLHQLTNQYLVVPSDKMTVLRDLCGVQSQFMVNAMHALKIRCHDYDEAALKNGLVKNWTIRGTVHVFSDSSGRSRAGNRQKIFYKHRPRDHP